MKIVNQGILNICTVLGKQEFRDTKYRLMKYLLSTECDEGLILQNTITGQMVLLNKEEAEVIKKKPISIKNNLISLIEDYYLVPEEYDEKKLVQQLRKILRRLLERKGIESYTILTTTNCNARCFYCYENELSRIDMDEKTADKLVEYIDAHKKNGKVQLHWFGGEPLIREDRITQICKALRDRKIKYISGMTSNGYLFTDDLIQKAVSEWKLGRVQITIDGTEEIYNDTKKYVGVKDSPYKHVLDNIRKLLEKNIYVIIRLNLDQHNIQDLWKVVDELWVLAKGYDNIYVYTHVLFEEAGFMPIHRDEKTREMLYDAQINLNKHLEDLGLYTGQKTLPVLKTHNCMADTDDAIVVYPNGDFYKCEHVQKGDEIGSIESEILDEYNRNKFLVTVEWDECGNCPIYPSCILLENCQGKEDKNRFTCQYDIELYKQLLVRHYKASQSSNDSNNTLYKV